MFPGEDSACVITAGRHCRYPTAPVTSRKNISWFTKRKRSWVVREDSVLDRLKLLSYSLWIFFERDLISEIQGKVT